VSGNDRRSLASLWTRFTLARPRWILLGVLISTLFFAWGITRIEFGTRILDFYGHDSNELIRTIESDFRESVDLEIIFVTKHPGRSLIEPEMLHKQFRVLKAIRERFPVDTQSLPDAIDEGLRRARKKPLLEVTDYTDVAQGVLGLSGGRTVRDLEKVTRNLLSHPEAIGFYTRLRFAMGVLPGGFLPMQKSGGPSGASRAKFFPPKLEAVKGFIKWEGPEDLGTRTRTELQIRDVARSFIDEDLDIYLLSRELVAAEIDERTTENIALLGLTVTAATIALYWIFFTSAQEVLIPLVLVGIAAIWTFGLAGWTGIHIGFVHLLALPILVGTGNDDAFVFGSQLRVEREETRELAQAIERTFAKVGRAIFLTTLTTCVAFAAAAWASNDTALKTFYLLVAVSMVVVFFLTVLLQGPLRVSGRRNQAASPARSPLEVSLHKAFLGVSARAAEPSLRYITRHPRVLWVLLLATLAGMCLSLGLRTEFRAKLFLRPDMQTFAAYDVDEKYYGNTYPGYLLIEGNVENPEVVRRLKHVQENLAQYPLAQRVLYGANVNSITELIDKLFIPITPHTDMQSVFDRVTTNTKTADFVLDETFQEAAAHRVRKRAGRYDGLLVKFFVSGPGDKGENVRTFVAQLEHELAKAGLYDRPDVTIRVGGGLIVDSIEEAHMFGGMVQGFLVSLLINFLVLCLVWRSLSLASIAVFPLLLSGAITVATMLLFGVKLNVMNLGLGAIVIGVGIDYPIHILEAYFEAGGSGAENPCEAMRGALRSMGPSLWAGAATTMVGFAACSLLGMPGAVTFSLLMTWALFCTFLAALVVLPALALRSRVAT
jgi:uncharacterized protein